MLNRSPASSTASHNAHTSSERVRQETIAVLEEVAAGETWASEQLDSRERIVRHVVLPHEWAPGSELTPPMKLRRRSIGARYGGLIEGLYSV